MVELQTNFGGGKTHSMISLYHLVGGEIDPKTIPGLDSVISESGTDKLPVANRAVLVGQKLNVAKGKTKPDSITTNTLWGEMAYQLGGAKGYALVAENDSQVRAPARTPSKSYSIASLRH